jgi:hypothetical protein
MAGYGLATSKSAKAYTWASNTLSWSTIVLPTPLVGMYLPSITMISKYFLSRILRSLTMIQATGIFPMKRMLVPLEDRGANVERRDTGIGLIMNFARDRATLMELSLGMLVEHCTIIRFGHSYLFLGDVEHRRALAAWVYCILYPADRISVMN